MSRARRCGAAVIALLSIGLSGCGGAGEHMVVVRIGRSAITKATIDRWTDAVRHGGAFTAAHGEPRAGSARARALALLISSDWLIGEAEREGLALSQEDVDQLLAEQMHGSQPASFEQHLAAGGQTLAGVKLEIRAELALEAIRERVAERAAAPVTAAEARSFYRSNIGDFSTPAVSVTDIVENLPTAAAAKDLVKRVGTGRRFTQVAIRKKLAHSSGVLSGPADKKRVDYAIFAARPGVVSEPMQLAGAWTVFVVRKVIPARPQPFATVRDVAARGLQEQRRRELLGDLDREFGRYWRSRTTCRRGYVVAGCKQSGKALGAYEDPFGTG